MKEKVTGISSNPRSISLEEASDLLHDSIDVDTLRYEHNVEDAEVTFVLNDVRQRVIIYYKAVSATIEDDF